MGLRQIICHQWAIVVQVKGVKGQAVPQAQHSGAISNRDHIIKGVTEGDNIIDGEVTVALLIILE